MGPSGASHFFVGRLIGSLLRVFRPVFFDQHLVIDKLLHDLRLLRPSQRALDFALPLVNGALHGILQLGKRRLLRVALVLGRRLEPGTVGDDKIEALLLSMPKLGGLTPRAIRTHLGLNKPIYRKTAAYGHFGRKPEGDLFPWERLDLVEDLKAALG